ncbi:MAG: hypothetical protein A2X19_11035 [Bacteroidetes bacterium GWE2_39_28]|nr:MAG: hypothetical protein A2X19_11035 [Bacteroidetes bacterium GWE2_39_28]OFY13474.1 MAG: hypothetical protein A2X16_07345 [Bacteroidetes bacterium GWF2_39_10]OFZ07634.1 MAG: hypothetical protein A2322_04825 [Bacteroidetes bacterium RIFOXYB2_FULL_39_7]OFZ09693.1 MAG: hypothetical protein A2465_10965 [Bacteroidetes bacterium RIFOXYC2_FULL_39_11]
MRELVIVIVALFLISCEQENEINDLRVIDVESNVGKSRQVFLSEVAESIEYIPLETTEESFLGIPSRNQFVYENDLLFVCQKGDYFKIFNSKGNYLSAFNQRGNGPKEYVVPNMFVVDSSAKVLSIGSVRNIVEFKITGEYIRTINYPVEESLRGLRYNDLGKIGNNYYILSHNINTSKDNLNYSAIILDSTSKIVLKIPYPKISREFVNKLAQKKLFNGLRIPTSQITPRLFRFKNNVRVITETDENIISVNEDLLIDTVYRLKYGKYCIKNYPDSYNITTTNAPFLQLYGGIYESSAFLFMSFRTGKLPLKHWEYTNRNGVKMSSPVSCSYFNKKTGQFTFIDPCGLDEFGLIDDIEGGPAFWPRYISQDDYMVNHIDAFTFIQYAKTNNVSEKFKKIAASLNESNNLVLIRVKLKDK